MLFLLTTQFYDTHINCTQLSAGVRCMVDFKRGWNLPILVAAMCYRFVPPELLLLLVVPPNTVANTQQFAGGRYG